MKNKQQIAYVITKHSDPNSKLIDYLVNRANCITINDCYVDINYGFSSDKKVVDKTSDAIDAYLLDFKKRIIGYVDIIILDYNTEDDYIKASSYGITILKYAKAHSKKIIFTNELQYK